MRWAACAALLALGCATAPITVTYWPGGPGVDPELASVEIRPEAYGRVCYDVRLEPDGTVAVTVAQDGSSDWVGVRMLPSILPQVVSAVMAVAGAPMNALLAALGVEPEPLQAPSPLSACAAIFEE